MLGYQATITLYLFTVFPAVLFGITTIHHDKPEESRISKMATKMHTEYNNKNATVHPERQKRLLPYMNYYLSHNTQRQSDVIQPQYEKFTPFLESNALPGPFVPIRKPSKNPAVEYTTPHIPIEKNPDFAAIYDTLVQLKQAQQISRPPVRYNVDQVYRKPQIKYVPTHYYDNQQYRESIQPVKTIIETYTPTNIDITPENKPTHVKDYGQQVIYKVYSEKPQVNEPYRIEEPRFNYRTQNYEQEVTTTKPYYVRKPIILYQQKPVEIQNEKPAVFAVQTTQKPPGNTIIEEKYVAQKFTPISTTQNVNYETKQYYSPVKFITEPYYSTPPPQTVQEHKPTENINILGKILKQLQNSNTLPRTLTTENIDNSIRTLVKILGNLRKQERIKTKPIIVAEEGEEELEDEIEEPPHYVPVPGTITQTFPANTIEGGTPGRPGIDYPALSSIPQTSFDCKTQRYKGFFGDPHTNCQVWHYCDLNGGQASFLCPNGTIFSQVALTCDWWYNVKCSSTPQLYVLNERLYKYIIPLAPKFPEDYSGPLVDRYLALKFKEMEEKMKNENKKEDKSEEKDDSDQLQDIQNEKARQSSEET